MTKLRISSKVVRARSLAIYELDRLIEYVRTIDPELEPHDATVLASFILSDLPKLFRQNPELANSLPALTSANPTALEIYAAIIQTAHTWLNANTDASVLATSDITISSPVTRNGTAKTQFQFTERFYGTYNAPTFDPNAV